MARKRHHRSRSHLGSPVAASKWFESASHNYGRLAKQKPSCGQAEHYVDVIAEATAANALAQEAGYENMTIAAGQLTSDATRQFRKAISLCKRG